jgi:peptidoglycan/LPS O-acetylase OafA/YrhL
VDQYVPAKAGAWAVIVGLNNSAFNGVAAVIVFFVISGFCIHFAYACGQPFAVLPFLARRLLRIAIPVVCAIGLASLMGAEARGALGAVLWTLYYEMIYYVVYPLLRIIFRSLGVVGCLAISTVVSLGLIASHWGTPYYWQFPLFYGWLVPLPAWLFGCLLGEVVANRTVWRNAHDIWVWRLFGLAYAASAQAYFFHGVIYVGLPALLFPFIVYSYFWLDREISHMRVVGVWPPLEWAGNWSYSVYLIHGLVLAEFDLLHLTIDPVLVWAVKLIAILLASYCFYLVIEWPAHQFARQAGYRLAKYSSG